MATSSSSRRNSGSTVSMSGSVNGDESKGFWKNIVNTFTRSRSNSTSSHVTISNEPIDIVSAPIKDFHHSNDVLVMENLPPVHATHHSRAGSVASIAEELPGGYDSDSSVEHLQYSPRESVKSVDRPNSESLLNTLRRWSRGSSSGSKMLDESLVTHHSMEQPILDTPPAMPRRPSFFGDNSRSPSVTRSRKNSIRVSLLEAVQAQDPVLVSAVLKQNMFLPAEATQSVHLAISTRQLDSTRILITALPELLSESRMYPESFTPLLAACKEGDEAMVELLLALNCDLHATTITIEPPAAMGTPQRLSNDEADLALRPGTGALGIAAYYGHVELVEMLLDQELPIEERDSSGRTPLLLSAMRGHLDVVSLLLDRGACRDTLSNENHNALWLAARFGHIEMTAWLLSRGCDFDMYSACGLTPMLAAAKYDHSDIAILLIDNGSDRNAGVIDTGETILHISARLGNEELLEHCASISFDMEVRDLAGRTPMHAAACAGQLDILDLLVGLKCSITAVDNQGNSILHLALLSNQFTVAQALIGRFDKIDLEARGEDDYTPFLLVCKMGHLACMRMLINAGCQRNTLDKDGNCAMCIAVWSNQLSVLRWLLENRFPTETRGKKGFTPLLAAAYLGHDEVIHLLLNYSNWGAVDANQNCALCLACSEGHSGVVEMLVSSGWNIESRGGGGATPFLLACKYGHEDVAHVLLRDSCDSEAVTDCGNGAMNIAAENNQLAMVDWLLSHASDINFRGANGCTPLHLSAQHGHSAIVATLLHHGANFNLVDDSRYTPLMYAAISGHKDVLDQLVAVGSDLFLRNDDDLDAFGLAVQHGQLEIVDSLVSLHDFRETELPESSAMTLACKHGQTDMVRALVRYGWCVHQPTSDDLLPPFLLACGSGHVQTVQALIELGASPSVVTTLGDSGAHLAAEAGFTDLLEALQSLNVDLSARGNNGETPFFRACAMGHVQVVELLHRLGHAVPICHNVNGDTPLHAAVLNNHVEVSQYLLQHSLCSLEATGANQLTPLLSASVAGHRLVVEYLISAGASTEAIDLDGDNALHLAVMNNRFLTSKSLIAAGMDVNAKNKAGQTPFICAAIAGHVNILKMLERVPMCNICERDNKYRSALSLSCLQGNVDVVKYLLSLSSTYPALNSIDADGYWPLHLACLAARDEVVELWLNTVSSITPTGRDNPVELSTPHQPSAEDVNLLTNSGATCLMLVTEQANLNLMNLLISRGANTEIADANGHTAFLLAVRLGGLAPLQLLLDQGVMVEKVNSRGLDALCIAGEQHQWDVLQVLLSIPLDPNRRVVTNPRSNGGRISPLQWAIVTNNAALAEKLISAGGHLTGHEPDDVDPLVLAVQFRSPDCLALLVREFGLDLNLATDGNGDAAIHVLARSGNSDDSTAAADFLVLLHQLGCNLDTRNSDGKNALQLSIPSKDLVFACRLLELGANVNAEDSRLRTPLFDAVECDSLPAVNLLIQAGATIDKRDCDDITPVMFAVMISRHSVLEALLQAGADPNLLDSQGRSALICASQQDDAESTRLLLSFSADPLIRDSREMTAYDYSLSSQSNTVRRQLPKSSPDRQTAPVVPKRRCCAFFL